MGGPPLIGLSLLYLGAALASAGVSLRLVRAPASKVGDASPALGALLGAALCGVYGLFALLMLPSLPLVYPYPDVTLMPGLALALMGAVLTISGLAIVRLSNAR